MNTLIAIIKSENAKGPGRSAAWPRISAIHFTISTNTFFFFKSVYIVKVFVNSAIIRCRKKGNSRLNCRSYSRSLAFSDDYYRFVIYAVYIVKAKVNFEFKTVANLITDGEPTAARPTARSLLTTLNQGMNRKCRTRTNRWRTLQLL